MIGFVLGGFGKGFWVWIIRRITRRGTKAEKISKGTRRPDLALPRRASGAGLGGGMSQGRNAADEQRAAWPAQRERGSGRAGATGAVRLPAARLPCSDGSHLQRRCHWRPGARATSAGSLQRGAGHSDYVMHPRRRTTRSRLRWLAGSPLGFPLLPRWPFAASRPCSGTSGGGLAVAAVQPNDSVIGGRTGSVGHRASSRRETTALGT